MTFAAQPEAIWLSNWISEFITKPKHPLTKCLVSEQTVFIEVNVGIKTRQQEEKNTRCLTKAN